MKHDATLHLAFLRCSLSISTFLNQLDDPIPALAPVHCQRCEETLSWPGLGSHDFNRGRQNPDIRRSRKLRRARPSAIARTRFLQ